MPFYSDNYSSTDTAGRLFFDADAVLDMISRGLLVEKLADDPDGERVRIVRVLNNQELVRNILVHRQGRDGQRDDTRDVLVFSPAQLTRLPDAVQDRLVQFERVQRHRNPAFPGRREGVTRPPRVELAAESEGIR